MDLIAPTIPEWKVWKSELSKLFEFAVDTRYPSQSDVDLTIQTCEKIRHTIREHMKLNDENDENEIDEI